MAVGKAALRGCVLQREIFRLVVDERFDLPKA
jgi:hypothetical protein